MDVWLVVRENETVMAGRIPAAWGRVAVGSLAAEPVTWAELTAAAHRFAEKPDLGPWADVRPIRTDEMLVQAGSGPAAGNIWMDLARQRLCVLGDESMRERSGAAPYLEPGGRSPFELPYRLPPEWEVCESYAEWQRPGPNTEPGVRCDTRSILYGTLPRALAELCRAVDRWDPETITAIHAHWLSTPRGDLAGRSPRDLLVERLEWIDLDLEHQAFRWMRCGGCVPLAEDAHAVQVAAYGSFEWALYYDLVRQMLDSARRECGAYGGRPPASLEARLASDLGAWLEQPQDLLYGATPQSIMLRERRRVPMTVPPDSLDNLYEDDCRWCRMLRDEAGNVPVFWYLTGEEMDPGFVFSPYRERADWEAMERRFRDFNRKLDEEQAARGSPDHG